MLKVSVKTKSVPVAIEDESGVELTYHLIQFTGATADEYREQQASKIEIDAKGNVTAFKDFKGQYLDLLEKTLKGPDGQLVARSVLAGWSDESLKVLHGESAKLNKLTVDEDAEVDPKKS